MDRCHSVKGNTEEVCLSRYGREAKGLQGSPEPAPACLVDLKRPAQEVRIPQRTDAGGLCQGTRLERKFDLQEIGDERIVRKAIPYADAGDAIRFGERPERDNIVVPVPHRVRILGIVPRVFKIRFIEDDEDARGNLPDEGV